MNQATDTDIRAIRTVVESIAKATEANTKAIADLTLAITESEIDSEVITDNKPSVTADDSHQSAPISAEKPDRDSTFNSEATFCNNSGVEKPLLR
jgi:hypothetical protein